MTTFDTDQPRIGEDPTKTILSESKLHEKSLCDYIINVATGCRHGCRFCYVPGTPNIRARGEMLEEELDVEDGQEEWGDYILYRDQITDELDGLLDRKRTWKETEKGLGVVGMSFHTDCFMDPRAAEITVSAIKDLVDHGKHVRVLTRNPMLASAYMNVFVEAGDQITIGSSIPTLNEDHIAAIEPDAPPIEARLRGLKRFRDAGVQTFVSMSPTYPTIDGPGGMSRLMERIAEVDPEVVFHEPINPRGKNYEMTVAAAEDAGCDDLAQALVEVQGPDAWLRYACEQFEWVQELGDGLNIPVHLWPDRELVDHASFPEATWLQDWRGRQPPEDFANRELPEGPPMSPPPLFTWEEQFNLEEYE